jgi:septal ring factor EnvC (AmiA/AmiB activator)
MSESQQSLEDQLAILKSYVSNAESELTSLKNGRKASSARARKSLQSIKNQSHTMRKAITSYSKSLPVKTRSKKDPPAPLNVDKADSTDEELPPAPKLARQKTKAIKIPATAPPPVKKAPAKKKSKVPE